MSAYKEIVLSADEILQMLDGSLSWTEVSSRLTVFTVEDVNEVRETEKTPNDGNQTSETLETNSKEASQGFEGRQVAVLLTFTGVFTLSLWLYFFFSA